MNDTRRLSISGYTCEVKDTTRGIKYGVKKPPAVSLTAEQLSVAVSSRRWCLGQN